MNQSEHNYYNQITQDMEADFLLLGDYFMEHCEEIIFGSDFPELKYFCFHLYNDNYTKNIFSKLSYRIERLYKLTDAQYYPNLSAGFGNLLIYLKEPILRENDMDYKADNYRYWLEVIRKDPDLVKYSTPFRKYLTEL